MRVMVIVKATADSEAGLLPSTELLEAMGRYNQMLVDAGVMLAAAISVSPSFQVSCPSSLSCSATLPRVRASMANTARPGRVASRRQTSTSWSWSGAVREATSSVVQPPAWSRLVAVIEPYF